MCVGTSALGEFASGQAYAMQIRERLERSPAREGSKVGPSTSCHLRLPILRWLLVCLPACLLVGLSVCHTHQVLFRQPCFARGLDKKPSPLPDFLEVLGFLHVSDDDNDASDDDNDADEDTR